MPAVYRLEVSNNNRAGCQNTECKKSGVKIQKGELRHGTLAEINGAQSWRFKHWGCVTPVQMETWKDITGGDPDLIDGLDELPDEMKEKVLRAFEQGHVDDEDWKGDVERNRPGQKGFRTPNSVKKEMDKEAALAEEGEEGEQSPTKKKAGRSRKRKATDAEGDVEMEDDEKPKKGRGRPKGKKAAKSEPEEEDEEMPDAAPVAKKGRGRPKNAVKAEADDDEEADAAPAAKKGRGRPKKAGNATETETEPPAKKSKKRTMATLIGGASEDEEEKPVVEKAKARGRGRPKKDA